MEMWIVPKKKSLEQRSHFGSHSQTDGMWKPREWLIRVRQNSQCSSIQGTSREGCKNRDKKALFSAHSLRDEQKGKMAEKRARSPRSPESGYCRPNQENFMRTEARCNRFRRGWGTWGSEGGGDRLCLKMVQKGRREMGKNAGGDIQLMVWIFIWSLFSF